MYTSPGAGARFRADSQGTHERNATVTGVYDSALTFMHLRHTAVKKETEEEEDGMTENPIAVTHEHDHDNDQTNPMQMHRKMSASSIVRKLSTSMMRKNSKNTSTDTAAKSGRKLSFGRKLSWTSNSAPAANGPVDAAEDQERMHKRTESLGRSLEFASKANGKKHASGLTKKKPRTPKEPQ